MVERRVRRGPVHGVAADEDRLLHAVLVAVLEQLPGAAEVDAVALLGVGREVGDGRHVNERVRPRDSKHVLGGALANVDLVHLDAFGDVGPGTTVDADDLDARDERAGTQRRAPTFR